MTLAFPTLMITVQMVLTKEEELDLKWEWVPMWHPYSLVLFVWLVIFTFPFLFITIFIKSSFWVSNKEMSEFNVVHKKKNKRAKCATIVGLENVIIDGDINCSCLGVSLCSYQ